MIKLLSLFSGIGAFEKALDNIGVEHDLVGFSEIDKYAVKSYCAIHGVDESMNLGDITKISEADLPKNIDLITYGFPCQDISLAGKQKGMFNEDGTQTRSGLFFEALRIIETAKPRIAIAENVKNLTGKKFKEQFEIVLKSLEDAGYNNYWKVLNAKDYGIPQNRERVFIISIRKDIDDGKFVFPEAVPLELRLKDMLEDEVDEKYYLSEKGRLYVTDPKRLQHKYTQVDGDVSLCVTAKGNQNWTGTFISVKEPQINMVGMLDMKGNEQVRRVYGADGLSPTLNTMQGGHRQPKVLVNITAVAVRGRYNEDGKVEQHIERTDREIANAVTTIQKDSMVESGLRIRKLTPKECWRLMGFEDTDFEKAEKVNSNTQLYKQAGNSIVVSVLENIFSQLRGYL